MALGIVGEELMVRVGPDGYERALARAHAREMDFTGRSTRAFVFVAPSDRDEAIAGLVGRAGCRIREESAPEADQAWSRAHARQVTSSPQNAIRGRVDDPGLTAVFTTAHRYSR